jgi:hypothetical protein
MTTTVDKASDIDDLLKNISSVDSEEKKKQDEERKKRRNARLADGKTKRERFLIGEVTTPKLEDNEKIVRTNTTSADNNKAALVPNNNNAPVLSEKEILFRKAIVCLLSFYVAFCILSFVTSQVSLLITYCKLLTILYCGTQPFIL